MGRAFNLASLLNGSGLVNLPTKVTGALPDANAPSGSVIQVVQHKITTRSVVSAPGTGTITATSGGEYTSFSFTPTLSNSNLLLLSSTFLVGEASNDADTYYVSASYGGSVLIGSVTNYAGWNHWGNNFDTTFVSFNHIFSSWGTDTRTISIRVGTTGTASIAVNYPNAPTTYAYNFNSPNQHEVAFTVMEIAP